MVRKTIRIYKFHDADLFYLAEHYHYNFQKAIYCAIREYLKKESCRIALPDKLDEPISIPKKSICRTLSLHEDKDKDVLEFLQRIPKGHVNGMIKNILRAYLCCPIMEEWADEYNQVFYKEKRVIQAATYNKKKKSVKKESTQHRKSNKNNESHNISEPNTKNEPVMFSNQNELKNTDLFYPEKDKKIEFTERTEEDLLTDAFSAFFD